MNIEFMSGPIAFDNEPVTGAPYSAEAVTEMVQTLADGNRIVRESKAQIARDGKGRTRREQGLAMFGPLVGGLPGAEHAAPHPDFRSSEQDNDHARPAAPHGSSSTGASFQDRRAESRRDQGARESVDVDHFEMALPAPPPGMESRASTGAVHVYSGRKIVVESALGRTATTYGRARR